MLFVSLSDVLSKSESIKKKWRVHVNHGKKISKCHQSWPQNWPRKICNFKCEVAGFTVFFIHPLWASNPLGGRDTRSRWKGACVRHHASHGQNNLSITWGTNPAPTKLWPSQRVVPGVSTQIKSCNFQSYTLTFMATPSAFEPRPTASRGFSRDGKRGANHARAWVFSWIC